MMYTLAESLYCTSELNITLHVKYTRSKIKNKIKNSISSILKKISAIIPGDKLLKQEANQKKLRKYRA